MVALLVVLPVAQAVDSMVEPAAGGATMAAPMAAGTRVETGEWKEGRVVARAVVTSVALMAVVEATVVAVGKVVYWEVVAEAGAAVGTVVYWEAVAEAGVAMVAATAEEGMAVAAKVQAHFAYRPE